MSKKQKNNKREKDIKGLGTTHGLAQTLRPSPSSSLVIIIIIIIIIIIKEMNDILFIFYFILFYFKSQLSNL